MWFEPLAEVGTLLAGCAAMLGSAMLLFKKSENWVSAFSGNTPRIRNYAEMATLEEQETFK
ncbi:hypothetical protein K3555_12850 [Leisingera sp. M527]|uniref:hypothetical protein n=1 Tax=Leisingera sp. M527 TaxID=2867014 RepID=UPI0021A6AD31|nr:hypothetical protein [Leisingera sp. M527]UWQ31489.1 hypothetical protein K3555_12850 [Leisingera sp. M527]